MILPPSKPRSERSAALTVELMTASSTNSAVCTTGVDVVLAVDMSLGDAQATTIVPVVSARDRCVRNEFHTMARASFRPAVSRQKTLRV